jgi:hypothetical protein|nr:MAG TPA: hypothetical protein [Caudoviricetes sp.]
MANFGSKNETFAYLVGKDIAEIKAKIEGIGTTSGGLDVLKVIVPAATEEQVNNKVLATVNLPDNFKNSLVLMESYGSYNTATMYDDAQFFMDTTEKEFFIIKLTNFKNPKETVRATIKESSGFHGSDA